MTLPSTYLKMHSTLHANGTLTMDMSEEAMPAPKTGEIVVRVEATPINPSDLGVMFGWANISGATTEGEGTSSVLSMPVPPQGMAVMKARLDQRLAIGNEGAGTVVAAGDDDYSQSLIGKTVAIMGGGMYGQYRCVPSMMALPLKDEHSAKDGASSFVNPLTALSMVEVMKMEGHKALVHTAAASNLGQMLNRICQADGVDLVNIVRKQEQVDLLKGMGAKYVVNSSDDDFMAQLTDAVHETAATLAFDATGGGTLASDILTAMEMAAARTPSEYSIYGSTTHKQVYIYGGLDVSPTTLSRNYGFAWGIGAFLLPNFLAKAGMEVAARLRGRVADELTTTFASSYTDEISMVEALQADVAQRYFAKATGTKYLLLPHKDI
ncbi:zinc-binding dehydrogenase [Alterisphingorhabdus coralli]|uniref:Zinc-binding dehydrogenase n=1 Tax=Alterisphingorhabdus coralli TaxID=3071408 RepID=A0AA97F7K7_9SPHN|nr:zinc-binding dehydrogenase [Parasphingorhabdus sp. SCSIO 66989]WOE75849.1 zinc-binding dehydrogenase [Parasphingorhabdus sp. SCSIO 66989]